MMNSNFFSQSSPDLLSFLFYLGFGFSIGAFSSWFLGKIEAEDEKWMLFKFIIALKKGGKEADDVRQFIKSKSELQN